MFHLSVRWLGTGGDTCRSPMINSGSVEKISGNPYGVVAGAVSEKMLRDHREEGRSQVNQQK